MTARSSLSPRPALASLSAALLLLAALACGAACTPNDDAPEDAGVVAPPSVSIVSFSASRSSVSHGSVVTLSWATRAAALCTLSPGFGAVPRSGSVEHTPLATTTYTLACEGGGKSASEDVTVQVLGGDGGSPDGGPLDAGDPDAGPLFELAGSVAEAALESGFDELTDGSFIWLVAEREDVTLDEDLRCDVHFPTTYDGDYGASEPRCTIPAGTRVDSYLLHALGTEEEPNEASGTVTFAREIVALQWRSSTLALGDAALARPDLAYPDPGTRDFGVGYTDAVTLGPDRRTLTITVVANNLDDLRVITLAEDEPPPLVLSTTLTPLHEVESLVGGAREALDEAVWLTERTVTLEEALGVDVTETGRYTDNGALSPGTLNAGTTVASALIHFDPPFVDAGTSDLVVSATLPSRVLGLVVGVEGLRVTDGVLGLEGTSYSTADGRFVELGSVGDLWLAEDGRSLRLELSVGGGSTGIDNLRVLYAP